VRDPRPPGTRPWLALLSLTLVSLPGLAGAQASPGLGANALPAVARLGVPIDGVPEVGIAASAGYAWTEPIDESEPHHRAFGSIAASVRPFEWGSIFLRLDGRYDRHPDDVIGQDDGFLGLPRLGMRIGGRVVPQLAIGGEVELAVPGANAPSVVPEALTLEGRLLAALTLPDDGLFVTAMGGFRFDNTGATVSRPIRLRRGDTIALGASDFHAVIFGLGASYRIDVVELLAEVTGDVYVGDYAPTADYFPFRVDLGARFYVMEGLAIEVGAELLANVRRPYVYDEADLIPIEPRFAAHAGLRFTLPLVSPPAQEIAAPEPPPEVEPPEPPPPATVDARGHVRDENGNALAGARLTLRREGAEPISVETDAEGAYAFTGLAPGAAILAIEAEGYQNVERPIELGAEAELDASIALEPALPSGELRGLVRSFNDGRPLDARVLVEDVGAETRTDADGFFEIDVAPGPHTVIIEAEGHAPQRREVDVPEGGVTVVNVELRRGRRGR
jgi:hypothetical protein